MMTDQQIQDMAEKAEERQPSDKALNFHEAVKQRVEAMHGAGSPKPLNRHERRREAVLARRRGR